MKSTCYLCKHFFKTACCERRGRAGDVGGGGELSSSVAVLVMDGGIVSPFVADVLGAYPSSVPFESTVREARVGQIGSHLVGAGVSQTVTVHRDLDTTNLRSFDRHFGVYQQKQKGLNPAIKKC